MNELIGSAVLTMLIGAIAYFIIAGKLKFGFEATLGLAIPLVLILALGVTGFSALYAFLTLIVGFMLAWVFNKIIGNR